MFASIQNWVILLNLPAIYLFLHLKLNLNIYKAFNCIHSIIIQNFEGFEDWFSFKYSFNNSKSKGIY